MRVGMTMKPGQPGTKKLLAKYGERLLAVRYRYDESNQARHTTVELIEESVAWAPGVNARPSAPPETLAIRIDWSEAALRQNVADAGGRWDCTRKLWFLDYRTTKSLGLLERAVPISAAHISSTGV